MCVFNVCQGGKKRKSHFLRQCVHNVERLYTQPDDDNLKDKQSFFLLVASTGKNMRFFLSFLPRRVDYSAAIFTFAGDAGERDPNVYN